MRWGSSPLDRPLLRLGCRRRSAGRLLRDMRSPALASSPGLGISALSGGMRVLPAEMCMKIHSCKYVHNCRLPAGWVLLRSFAQAFLARRRSRFCPPAHPAKSSAGSSFFSSLFHYLPSLLPWLPSPFLPGGVSPAQCGTSLARHEVPRTGQQPRPRHQRATGGMRVLPAELSMEIHSCKYIHTCGLPMG